MCGIIGILGTAPAAPLLLEALRRLEYRGYDSAGIATLTGGAIGRRRAEGKLDNLASVLDAQPLEGVMGIGHTRWATHGAPTEGNAHPHATDKVAVVHNGIIENFRELRAEVEAKGHVMTSDTDSEVIAHLLSAALEEGQSPVEAAAAVLKRLDGAFGLAMLFSGHDGLMIGARRGSPLVVGYGEGEMYLGSDAIAVGPLSDRISYLEEGDWVVLTQNSAQIYDATDCPVEREIHKTSSVGGTIEKGNFPHFMLKEIYEEPAVIGDTLSSYFNPQSRTVELPDLPFDLASIPRINIVACGTAFYAGLVARYWIEQLAGIPVEADIASEFRYRKPVLQEGGLSLFISQSGETADTLAALRHCKAEGQHVAAIVNVEGSTMTREADVVLPTHAGPEIGVASTKAFACQLTVLACLTVALARAKGRMDAEMESTVGQAITEIPARAADLLQHDEAIQAIARDIAPARTVLYLGRGGIYPIAMEGALKLKEISYIHAEGYPSGELKHGPIALIDKDVPIIVLAPRDALFEKSISNMQEVIARGGQVLMMSDAEGIRTQAEGTRWQIELPEVHDIAAPLLYTIPVHLLAYHVAVAKGTDVDQPRNLAKSVTVE